MTLKPPLRCCRLALADFAEIPSDDGTSSGSWDSLHVFECTERSRTAKYKLTSTVMLVLGTETITTPDAKGLENVTGKGNVTLSGSMTRQVRGCHPERLSRAHTPG